MLVNRIALINAVNDVERLCKANYDGLLKGLVHLDYFRASQLPFLLSAYYTSLK